jgi:transcriptional regulator with XRE-family HTH domain
LRLARLRKEKGYTKAEVTNYVCAHSDKTYSLKMVSHWEKGDSAPPLEQFLILCELYGVRDIQATFRGIDGEYRNLSRLNRLGKSRIEEYIALLASNPLFSENETFTEVPLRYIRLYDTPVVVGLGNFLDSETY